jgi:hypothetical protein
VPAEELGGLDIAKPVAHIPRLTEVDVVLRRRLLVHRGGRLATIAGGPGLGIVRTVVRRQHVRAGGRQQLVDARAHLLVLCHREQPAPDAGLIRHDEYRHPHRVDACDRGGGAGDQSHTLGARDVNGIDVDRAIAIEEESGAERAHSGGCL